MDYSDKKKNKFKLKTRAVEETTIPPLVKNDTFRLSHNIRLYHFKRQKQETDWRALEMFLDFVKVHRLCV